MLFLTPLLLAFTIALIGSYAVITLVRKYGKVNTSDRVSVRHCHGAQVSRWGGIVMIGAFLCAFFLDPHLFRSEATFFAMLIGIVLILIVGVWDDVKPLAWWWQLLLQGVIASVVFFIGMQNVDLVAQFITHVPTDIFVPVMPLINFVIIAGWLILMMNAMNWSDGIDGVSGGIAVISALTIFALSLFPEVNQPPLAILAVALAGAIGGFLVFNFTPAKILAGTSGALFMGFMLAMLAIIAGTKVATTLLVMAIPVVDALWVVSERLRHGQSIFKADRRHLHYRLIDLGWSTRTVALLYYGITILIAIIALNTHTLGKISTIVVVFALLLLFTAFVAWRVRHLEKIIKK